MNIQQRIKQLEEENKFLKVSIEFTEKSKRAGWSVNQDKLKMHTDALCYQEANKCDYVTALKAVGATLN